MLCIQSRIELGLILHLVIRRADITADRRNVSHNHEPLQVGVVAPSAGMSYRPHIHKPRESTIRLTQECWVVLSGEVLVEYYDLDGAFLESCVLTDGDVSITYRGGHGYTILRDAVVVEVKNGPYAGSAEQDKEFIR